jgi:hypothetical protein
MELLLFICAYLVGSAALGIAAGQVLTRRDLGEPARPAMREPASRPRNDCGRPR